MSEVQGFFTHRENGPETRPPATSDQEADSLTDEQRQRLALAPKANTLAREDEKAQQPREAYTFAP